MRAAYNILQREKINLPLSEKKLDTFPIWRSMNTRLHSSGETKKAFSYCQELKIYIQSYFSLTLEEIPSYRSVTSLILKRTRN